MTTAKCLQATAHFDRGTLIRDMFRAVCGVLCALVAYTTYLNAFRNEFAFDDRLAIVDNADTDSTRTDWWNLLVHDFWGQNIESTSSHKSWRPVPTATYRLEHAWLGQHIAWAAHTTNVVCHALATAALAAYLHYGERCRASVAVAAAMLFAVHPVHTEAGTGVVGRAEVHTHGNCIVVLNAALSNRCCPFYLEWLLWRVIERQCALRASGGSSQRWH